MRHWQNRFMSAVGGGGGGGDFVTLTPEGATPDPEPFDPSTLSPEVRMQIAQEEAVRSGAFVPMAEHQRVQEMLHQQRTPTPAPTPSDPGQEPTLESCGYVTEDFVTAHNRWAIAQMQSMRVDPNAIAQQVQQGVMQGLSPMLAGSVTQTTYRDLDPSVQPFVQQVVSELGPRGLGTDPDTVRTVRHLAIGRAVDAGAYSPGGGQRTGALPTNMGPSTAPVSIPSGFYEKINDYDQRMQRKGAPPMTNAERIELYQELQNAPDELQ